MKDKLLKCCNIDFVIIAAAAAWLLSVVTLVAG
jgi:hypothetical protein